ncbi:MAG: T9SS type A sorting domain-containing protein, partial [Bacteroidota bacterium]
DVDADGIVDTFDPVIETGSGSAGSAVMRTGAADANGFPVDYPVGDSDSDKIPDYIDIDSDADGIVDWIEAQPSGVASPTDGLIATTGVDTDGDGIDDGFDHMHQETGAALSGRYVNPVNTDGDAFDDYLDINSDNDSYNDELEGHDADKNGDVDRTALGTDSDMDGLDDAYDTFDRGTSGFRTNNYGGSNAPLQDFNEDVGSGGDRDWRDGRGWVLPVEYASFTVELRNGNGVLEWITLTELNSDHFAVERSENGATFQAVGQVSAAGTSNEAQQYTFTDPGINQLGQPIIYYRIRQVDIDGSFEFSQVLKVKVKLEKVQAELKIYPNPAKTEATISFQSHTIGTWEMEVIRLNGQSVFKQQIKSQRGENRVKLNVDTWPRGHYIVRIQRGAARLTRKLVVQ